MAEEKRTLVLAFSLLLISLNRVTFAADIVVLSTRGESAQRILRQSLTELENGGKENIIYVTVNQTYPTLDLDACKYACVFRGEVQTVIQEPTYFGGVPSGSTVRQGVPQKNSLIDEVVVANKREFFETLGLYRTKDSPSVYIHSPSDVQGLALRHLVEMMNLTSAAILYDDSYSVLDVSADILLVDLPARHLALRLDYNQTDGINVGVESIGKQVLQLSTLDLKNFFILVHPSTVCTVLRAIESQNMFTRRFSWIVFSKVKDAPECKVTSAQFLYGGIDPTRWVSLGFGLVPGTDNMNPGDNLYWNQMTSAILKSYRAVKASGWPQLPWSLDICLSGNFSSMSFNNTRLGVQLIEEVDKSSLVFRPANTTNKLQVTVSMSLDRYSITGKNGNNVEKKMLATWGDTSWNLKNGENLTVYGAALIYRVVVVQQPPFVVKLNDSAGRPYFDGYCIDLLKSLQELLGFEYEIYESPDGAYGSLAEDGSWSGMIKELVEKKADIALAALSVTAERETVIDFTVPYYDLVGITILMQKPIVPTSLFKFLTVLENDVWGCILAAYVVTGIILWVFDRYSPYSYTNDPGRYEHDEEKRIFTLKESLWFCMTSLTPQGGGEAPKHLSGRLVAATWWLFAFIIIASYTANLAAFLTVSRLETPVHSLDDLAAQYKIQYAPLNGSSVMTYFKRMAGIEDRFYEIWKDLSLNDSMPEFERSKLAVWDYPVSDKYTKMWQTMQDAGLPNTMQEALVRVRNSSSDGAGFAFLGDATDIRYQVLTNCDLQMVGDEFSRKPYALAVQDGSPLKDQLNDAILKLLNLRRLESLKEKWWTDNRDRATCVDESSSSDGISIENIGGVFVVIFVGIALSIVTLIFEYIYYKYFFKGDPEEELSTASASTIAGSSEGNPKYDWDRKILTDKNSPMAAW